MIIIINNYNGIVIVIINSNIIVIIINNNIINNITMIISSSINNIIIIINNLIIFSNIISITNNNIIMINIIIIILIMTHYRMLSMGQCAAQHLKSHIWFEGRRSSHSCVVLLGRVGLTGPMVLQIKPPSKSFHLQNNPCLRIRSCIRNFLPRDHVLLPYWLLIYLWTPGLTHHARCPESLKRFFFRPLTLFFVLVSSI